jgi:hypothetical protein
MRPEVRRTCLTPMPLTRLRASRTAALTCSNGCCPARRLEIARRGNTAGVDALGPGVPGAAQQRRQVYAVCASLTAVRLFGAEWCAADERSLCVGPGLAVHRAPAIWEDSSDRSGRAALHPGHGCGKDNASVSMSYR